MKIRTVADREVLEANCERAGRSLDQAGRLSGGFFKLAEPLIVSIAKRQFQSDLDNLKDLMEANAL